MLRRTGVLVYFVPYAVHGWWPHGVPQHHTPSSRLQAAAPPGKASTAPATPAAGAAAGKAGKGKADAKGAEKGKGAATAAGKGKGAAADKDKPVDVSRVDLRVGLITKASKHPDADSLYVEDIMCGEETPRVVVSGLVKHIPEPEMQQRLVVVVANLKPANLKGIKSHAMVLAATGADGKVRGQFACHCMHDGTARPRSQPDSNVGPPVCAALAPCEACASAVGRWSTCVRGRGGGCGCGCPGLRPLRPCEGCCMCAAIAARRDTTHATAPHGEGHIHTAAGPGLAAQAVFIRHVLTFWLRSVDVRHAN